MVINVTSNEEFNQLANLILSKAQIDWKNVCHCCDGDSLSSANVVGIVSDSDLYSRVYIAKLNFTVGAPGKPIAGDTKFVIKDNTGGLFVGVDLDIFREGFLLSPDEYTFAESNGVVTLSIPLVVNNTGHGERITVKIYKKQMITVANVATVANPSQFLPYNLPFNL